MKTPEQDVFVNNMLILAVVIAIASTILMWSSL